MIISAAKITLFAIFDSMITSNPKKTLLFLIAFIGCLNSNHVKATTNECKLSTVKFSVDSTQQIAALKFNAYAESVYEDLRDTSLSYTALVQGLKGYYNLSSEGKIKRKNTLTIIDFSKPSSQDRLFIIDLCNRKILHKSIVSHGVNTGRLYAQNFSNKPNSHKSSIGFYSTSTTYHGKYDLALRLDGLEYTNNKARSRGVVMHAAKYATYEFLEKNGGMLGRSYGCPALPFNHFEKVVEWIKEGTCLFIYYPSLSYQKNSVYLNQNQYLQEFLYL